MIDTAAVSSCLNAMGWSINNLKVPDGIQLVPGPVVDTYIEAFVTDLDRAVKAVKSERRVRHRRKAVYSDEIASGPGALI